VTENQSNDSDTISIDVPTPKIDYNSLASLPELTYDELKRDLKEFGLKPPFGYYISIKKQGPEGYLVTQKQWWITAIITEIILTGIFAWLHFCN